MVVRSISASKLNPPVPHCGTPSLEKGGLFRDPPSSRGMVVGQGVCSPVFPPKPSLFSIITPPSSLPKSSFTELGKYIKRYLKLPKYISNRPLTPSLKKEGDGFFDATSLLSSKEGMREDFEGIRGRFYEEIEEDLF